MRDLEAKRLDEKAKRLSKLGVIETSVVKYPQDVRAHGLISEAAQAYLHGLFRSCIFCCASIVEQTFRNEIVKSSSDPEKEYWKSILQKPTFGRIIDKAKKLKRLNPFKKDAKWLNAVRNNVAVHPLYVATSMEHPSKDELIWANKTMTRDIKKALPFLTFDEQEEIKAIEIRHVDEAGKEIMQVTVKDILKDPTCSDIFWLWFDASEKILETLAFKSYRKMAEIVEGLYPAD